MKKAIILFTISLSLLAACSDKNNPTGGGNANNRPPGAFTVAEVDTTGRDAVLTWTVATDPDGDPVTYSVFLDGEQVQAGLNSTTATLEGLEFETEFTGQVVASDGNGGSSQAAFSFTSRKIRIQWEVNLGGSGSDGARSIAQTDDRGYIVGGRSSSADGDVSTNNGDFDYWIVRLDPQGGLLWETSLGGSSFDVAFSIAQTADGGVIVGGYSISADGDVSANNGGFDYWIVRLDPQGGLLWETSLGGSGSDETRSIAQTADGGFIVGGRSNSADRDVSANNGGFDYWIVKLQ